MIHLYLHKLIEIRIQCIVICWYCVYMWVCGDHRRPITLSESLMQTCPHSVRSAQYRKEAQSSDELLPDMVPQRRRAADLTGHWLAPLQLWQHEQIKGDWRDRRRCEVLTARRAHGTFSRGQKLRSLTWMAAIWVLRHRQPAQSDSCFDWDEIKVEKCGKWSQYRV